MKIISSLTFLTLGFFAALLDTAGAQPLTITTIAGQFGVFGDPYSTNYDNGIGTNAVFNYPKSLVADQSGNLYVVDTGIVTKITPDGTVTILAGDKFNEGYFNATGTNALLQPTDIAVDKNGYVYVAESGNYVIRKISPAGVVTTLAGDGNSGYRDSANGTPEFVGPSAVAVDSSLNIYVMDQFRLRKITPTGVVSTVAGSAVPGCLDGNGTNAQFSPYYNPSGEDGFGMAVDAGGTVYLAVGYGIRKVSPNGDVSTWVGTTGYYYGTFEGFNFEADGILGNAGFDGAKHIALDRGGGAYVTDSFSGYIRYVSSAGVVTTVGGVVGFPYGVAVDATGNVYITDASRYTVLKGSPPSLSPIDSVSESAGITPIRSNNPWQFTAHFTNIVSDLRLRVQSTTTTNIEASWTDLPGNLYMTDVDGNWTLNTTNVPTGTQYFRVVASAPGYFDSVSAAVGPETVLGLPQLSDVGFFLLTTGGTPVRSSNPWQFVAAYTNLVPGLQLRVQSTTTTNDAGSWTDLPGIHFMTNNAGGWALDKTDVPTGVRYFRVVASALGYVDGMSSIVGPQTVLQGFDLWGYFSYATTVPYSTATPWGFAIGQPSQIPGMSLRVQFSRTPDDPNSWSYLPGGGQMTRQSDGVNWGIGTTNLPTTDLSTGANVFFRVIASASDYVDLVSADLGPFDIRAPLPVTTTTLTTGGTRTLQSFDLGQFFHAVGVFVHLIPADNTTTIQGAITLTADQGGGIDVLIKKGQEVKTAGLNVQAHAMVLLSGTIDGPVSVGIPVVSNDGGSVVGVNGSALASDGGTAGLAAQIAQNLLIGQDGSGLIGQDGSGLIGQDGSGLTGQAGHAVSVESKTPLTPSPKLTPPTQPTFTGQMTVNGNYSQFPGTALIIGIAGTNTLDEGAQQFDQLVVNGQVNFEGGTIVFVLLDPDDQTNLANAFQPPDGATFDVVVASNIVVNALHLLGPVWGDGMFFKGGVVTLTNGLQAVRLMATHIPPQIFLQNAGPEFHLLYGTNYTGYTVQSSPDLTNWSTFSTGTNVVPLSLTNASQFFRLSKP